MCQLGKGLVPRWLVKTSLDVAVKLFCRHNNYNQLTLRLPSVIWVSLTQSVKCLKKKLKLSRHEFHLNTVPYMSCPSFQHIKSALQTSDTRLTSVWVSSLLSWCPTNFGFDSPRYSHELTSTKKKYISNIYLINTYIYLYHICVYILYIIHCTYNTHILPFTCMHAYICVCIWECKWYSHFGRH